MQVWTFLSIYFLFSQNETRIGKQESIGNAQIWAVWFLTLASPGRKRSLKHAAAQAHLSGRSTGKPSQAPARNSRERFSSNRCKVELLTSLLSSPCLKALWAAADLAIREDALHEGVLNSNNIDGRSARESNALR